MASLTDEQAAYFAAANVGMLGTTRTDGSAHVSPVWVDYDGGRVVLNTVEGRAKWKHLVRDPRGTVTVTGAGNPYEYVEVSGPAELTTEGAEEHIDVMAKKYLGVDKYPFSQPGDKRVLVRISPERVTHYKP